VTLLPSTELTLETPADVSVHLVRIGNLGETMTERMAVRDILSADERERSERFVRPGLRGRFIYTRATLRHLLAERLNTTPKSLTFEQTKDGRPFLSQTEDPSRTACSPLLNVQRSTNSTNKPTKNSTATWNKPSEPCFSATGPAKRPT